MATENNEPAADDLKDNNNLSNPNAEVIAPKKPPHRFKPGNKMGGRTKGARNKFSEEFFKDFLADWEMAGAEAIQRVRLEDPSAYLRVAASLIPRELSIREGDGALDKLLEQFSNTELDKIIAGIAAIGFAEKGELDQDQANTGAEPNSVH